MSSKRNRGPLLLGTGGKYFDRCNHLGKKLLLNVLGLASIFSNLSWPSTCRAPLCRDDRNYTSVFRFYALGS